MTKNMPSNFAFPITVSRLRDELATAPQASEIEIAKYYSKTMTPRRYLKTHHGKTHGLPDDYGNVKLVTAQYERNAHAEHKWTLTLSAIKLDDLEKVRKLFEKEGYSKLAAWFASTNKYAGSIGTHYLRISFDGKQLAYKQYDSV
jgi:hypothetical protein